MELFRHFIKAFIVGIIVFIILALVQYANGYTFSDLGEILRWFVFNQIYAVILYLVNAYYFKFLLKWFPNAVFKTKNLLKGAFGGIFLTLITLFFIRITTETLIFGRTLDDFFAREQIANYYVGFTISVVVTSIFYTVYYYRNKQETKVTEQKIIAGTASAKFDALKNQLDPHFLFNSLNVLTSLIEENPEAATRFTTSLSKVYRYVLEQKNKELVTLEEELKFAQLYMSLLSVRFEDSIVFTSPKNLRNPQAKVVPLSLQLLLENAVKHNQVTPTKKLYIAISEKEGMLVVTNNIQMKQALKESTGVGLKNIRDRYALLTERSVEIHENRMEFRVAIPILDENIRIMNSQETFISEKRYQRAKKRVEELKVFYMHFGIYLVFIPIFIYLNFLSRAGFPWAIFPILGWGFGLASHAAETFNYNPFFGKKWEEEKIRQFMDKED
ncbi:histidine kinase [Aequorivita sp. H23M31]|uniref:Histidine kinase n=1 Tax=Aequorivita ciconiae TaxID=2494375 RepID=A0A410G6Q6_9FLAO|nr:2TM domain-containing protein [Aequorivita sp. H23M31]QAA82953.1 histidine kinase [Aequorivita sp. H23M31]